MTMMLSRWSQAVFLAIALLTRVHKLDGFPLSASKAQGASRPSTVLHSQDRRSSGSLPPARIDAAAADHGSDLLPPHLTVVIPAYNEELRIGETIESYQSYLSTSEKWKARTTILVVDDGSCDETANLVLHFGSARDNKLPILCLPLPSNQGKGAALARGIKEACERRPTGLILTADADGSAKVEGVEDLYASLVKELTKDGNTNDAIVWNQTVLVNGYRSYGFASPFRSILRWGFRTAVKLVCGNLGVKDSQCGFKLMTATAASPLYSNLNIKGWSHDVEVLYRARHFKIPVTECAISWQDKKGSKLTSSPGGVVFVSIQMFWEVVKIRLGYATGKWLFEDQKRKV